MPEIIRCTACNRQLQVPEDLLGQAVRCPTCQGVFTAAMNTPPVVQPAIPVVHPAARPQAPSNPFDFDAPSSPAQDDLGRSPEYSPVVRRPATNTGSGAGLMVGGCLLSLVGIFLSIAIIAAGSGRGVVFTGLIAAGIGLFIRGIIQSSKQ